MTSSLKRIIVLALVGALASLGLLVAPSATASTHDFYVKKGHKVTITLPTAADGGYGWVITKGKNSSKFEVLSKKVVYPKSNGTPGGDAKTVYVLRTLAYGNATFKAVERRAFDKSDVIDSFTLKLHITKSGKK
ncbi:MAG: hypothetical protein JWQ74_3465 [Marmoricola sp.]|nr:hypothetical protein [Marmoricola sp.]